MGLRRALARRYTAMRGIGAKWHHGNASGSSGNSDQAVAANPMSILARVGLLFDHQAEEEAFASSFARGNIRQTQAAMLLGGFVYYIFFIWDRVIDPARWETTHLIRSAVVVLVL